MEVFLVLILGAAGCAVWAQIWEREDLIAFASSYHDSMLGLELLCWIQVGPCWIYVGATWSSVGTTSAHVRSKLGLGWPILGLCWGYGSLNGSMLAHFEVLLGLCWLIWALCWGLELCWLKKLSPVACEAPTPFLQHHFSEKAESCLGFDRPMLDASRGHVEDLTQETLSPVASKVAVRSLRSIFSPKPCSCLGRALRKCPRKSPSWGYVGAMFAHLGAMLGLC